MFGKYTYQWFVKAFLLLCFGAMFILPHLQRRFKIFKVQPLKGYYVDIEEPHLSDKTFFSGRWSGEIETYTKQEMGFRADMIRFHNQLQFDLFKRSELRGVVVGKDNYLFERVYVNAYEGRDFIGRDSIAQLCDQLKFITDHLKDKGTDLLLVIAPGKSSYYPEYMPDWVDRSNTANSNVEVYRQELAERDLDVFDISKWYQEMKANSPYPLYNRSGVHWTSYGEFLTMDSLRGYINAKYQYNLAPLWMSHMELTDTCRGRDADIMESINLMYPIKEDTMAYPNFGVEAVPEADSLNAIVIADSYYWGLFNKGFSNQVLKGGQFWYYFHDIHPHEWGTNPTVPNINLEQAFADQDLIVILLTEANMYRTGFNFIQRYYTELKSREEQ